MSKVATHRRPFVPSSRVAAAAVGAQTVEQLPAQRGTRPTAPKQVLVSASMTPDNRPVQGRRRRCLAQDRDLDVFGVRAPQAGKQHAGDSACHEVEEGPGHPHAATPQGASHPTPHPGCGPRAVRRARLRGHHHRGDRRRSGRRGPTVYLAFGTKRALLVELLDIPAAGDEEPVALLERPWVDELRHHPDPRASCAAGSVRVATSPLTWQPCGRSPATPAPPTPTSPPKRTATRP
jgi:hypothetical protein